jgi:predicted HTH transcriptional regulator
MKAIGWIVKEWKCLWCSHEQGTFHRNIYGDEINYANARSVYQCTECGKYIHKQELNQSEEAKSVDFLHSIATMPIEMQRWLIQLSTHTEKSLAENWQKNKETKHLLSEIS